MFYGWWVVGAAFAATFGSVVFFNPVLGVFAQLLEDDFGWQRSQVALALSVGGLAAAAIAPFTGAAIDRWGGRWVIGGAAVGMALCALALSQMQVLWHLLLFFAIGRALSIGAMSPAGFVAAANWFIRRRPFVSGIVAVGPRVGMAIFPLIVALVIDATGTWRAGWVALALIALAVGVPALIFVRRRPEDVGLRPDGDPEPLDLDALPSAPPERDFTLREAVRTRGYWLIGFGVGLVMFCGGAINFHQIPHLIDQGLPRTQAALVVAVFSMMGALGSIIGGAVASRITMRWTMVPCLGGMAIGVLLLLNVTTVQTAMVYAVFYGLFFGAQVAMDQVVYAEYFGRRAVGMIRGSFQPVQLLMNAAGPFAAGLWYDQTGSYAGPFTLFAVLFLVAAAAIAMASYPTQPDRRNEPGGTISGRG